MSDDGTQFTSKECKQLLRSFELAHLRLRTYPPESSGVVERCHRLTREELEEVELRNLAQARDLIGRWVEHYNERRLHAGLDYVEPVGYSRGDSGGRSVDGDQ